jgi:very-short-patch-repair endonuclease
LACARDLQLLDMVVLTDAALHLRATAMSELESLSHERRRGAPVLRQALKHADGRSESAWESMLRMLHEACGVPVEPQYVVRDAAGSFVARADLWIKGTRTLHEYDGDDHLTAHRRRKDLGRDRRLDRVQWTRHGYTSHEVLKQAVSVLRDADRSLGRPHRPHRVRAWHALLMDSLFTPSGTERLRARWGLARTETGGNRSMRKP